MDKKQFAVRLSSLRTQKNISARELSLSIGQNPSYINRIENQKSYPSMQTFFYICETLGITPQDFFNTDSRCPEAVRQIDRQLSRLDTEQLAHISALIKSLSR